jgi:hypothetical protein
MSWLVGAGCEAPPHHGEPVAVPCSGAVLWWW